MEKSVLTRELKVTDYMTLTSEDINPLTGTFRNQDYSSKFRNAQNQLKTRALFVDQVTSGDYSNALYTLKDQDDNQYPSLYRLYMETEDLTEYEFALKYFESWDHWVIITLSNFMKPFITKWRNELDLKIRAKALKNIRREADDPKSKNSFGANKILIDRSWENKKVPVRGRPSNQEVNNQLKNMADEAKRLEEDFARINGD